MGLLIAVAAAFVIALVALYNRLANMRNIVRAAWSDVDVQLKRRAELIPNLVETAKGYSGFEQQTLESVTLARAGVSANDMSPQERASAEAELGARLQRMLAVVENYPELKASAQFLRLQEELSATETNIANARRYYNAAVRDYNTLVESFPSALVAAIFAYRKAEFFELDSPDEAVAPNARMSQDSEGSE
ncbi:MAG: LemA family protein [Armatimonadota bacterium]